MHTIRQTCGLAGFPKRDESVYDAFGAGHSSTSISAGLGATNSQKKLYIFFYFSIYLQILLTTCLCTMPFRDGSCQRLAGEEEPRNFGYRRWGHDSRPGIRGNEQCRLP